MFFSGYIRAKILMEKCEYDGIMRECTQELAACKEAGDKAEVDKEGNVVLRSNMSYDFTTHCKTVCRVVP